MAARHDCLREMEAAAMHLQNRMGGDKPIEEMTEAEIDYMTTFTERQFQRLSQKYSEADMRWAAAAIKDDSRYEETPTHTVHHTYETKQMGYWQSVGTRILVSFVVVGVLSLISVACQASGR